jgi:hypothetical protein
VQQAGSSTHKASLAMVVSPILQRWMLGVSSSIRLGDVGVGRQPLAMVVAGNPRDRFAFFTWSCISFSDKIKDHFM